MLEELLDAPDEAALNKMLEQHAEEITPELSSVIGNILARSEEQAGAKPQGEDAQTIAKLRALYNSRAQIFHEKEHELEIKISSKIELEGIILNRINDREQRLLFPFFKVC